MKIVYCTVARLGAQTAHEAYVVQLCRAFAGSGVGVELAAAELPGGARGLAARFGDLPSGLHLGLLGLAPARPGRAYALKLFLRLLTRAPDGEEVWITHHPLLALAAVLRRVPWVYDFHQLDPRARLLRFAMLSSTCRGVVFNAEVARQAYTRRHGGVGRPFLVSHNAITAADFSSLLPAAKAREALGLGGGRGLLFAYVGSLGAGRGIEDMIEAIRRLDQAFPGRAGLVIVGGREDQVSALRSSLESRGDAAGLVILAGHRAPCDLPLWYAASDCLLAPYSPSLPAAGVMNPMKLYEYAAAGRPVIASDLPAVREALEGNPVALLVPPDSADGLAAAMRRFVEQAPALADAARLHQRSALKNTWEAKASRLVRWLRAVAEADRPAR